MSWPRMSREGNIVEMRDILSKWKLSEIEIKEQFHSDTVRKIYKIHAHGKNYVLKGIPDRVPESEIASNVYAHRILGNEKKIAPEIYPTEEGFYYIHANGFWFYVMEFIEGRNMAETVEDELELGKLSRKLHSYKNYNVKSPMSQNTKRFYDWFYERTFKKEFDAILDSLPDFSEYEQCLIHSDLGPHNGMIRDNGEAVLIDLDDAGIGSKYMDLGWPIIMQFVDFDHATGDMHYRFDLAEAFLDGYYEKELIKQTEYDLIWKGAAYMHIAYMKSYGPDAVGSLWKILNFGMKQKDILWNRFVDKGKAALQADHNA